MDLIQGHPENSSLQYPSSYSTLTNPNSVSLLVRSIVQAGRIAGWYMLDATLFVDGTQMIGSRTIPRRSSTLYRVISPWGKYPMPTWVSQVYTLLEDISESYRREQTDFSNFPVVSGWMCLSAVNMQIWPWLGSTLTTVHLHWSFARSTSNMCDTRRVRGPTTRWRSRSRSQSDSMVTAASPSRMSCSSWIL